MAFASLRHIAFIHKTVLNVRYTTLLKRPISAYKSAISLENLYPNCALKLTTPAIAADPNEKFNGFIPIDKLDISFSASSGPGGQNVNKVHTKVDLRFKPSDATWLHPEVKNKLSEKYSKKITKDGYMIFRSDVTRSQQLNLADCMQKLRAVIRAAADDTAEREPSPETQERIRQRHLKAARLRLACKREASNKRDMRQPPTIHDL